MASPRALLLLALVPLVLLGCDSDDPNDNDIDLVALRLLFDCQSLTSINVGATVNGALTVNDCLAEDDTYADYFAFRLTSSRTVRIDLESSDFDAYLWLYRSNGDLVGTNDDGGQGLNARLVMSLSAGVYVISAASFDVGETGAYILRLQAQ